LENYTEYAFTIDPINPWQEILLAELAQFDFDSFEETPDGLKAYLPERLDQPELLSNLWLLNHSEVSIHYAKSVILPINWNKEWEENFKPILVENQCYVRAEFHPHQPNFAYEIVIQPKMSFGTGHHETTYLMLAFLLSLEVKNKTVMDMGCGTGILAILAKMKGAAKTYGIDFDQWAIENSIENKNRNQVEVDFYLGEANKLPQLNLKYDVFIANINKNILVRDIPIYAKYINPNGTLLLSGILHQDFDDIILVCKENDLEFIDKKQRGDWICVQLKKGL
jgi:ribosomal protein L11 methyltransferase